MLALSAPVLGLRLGFPDDGNDQAGSMTRTAYDLVSEGFGSGANGPLLMVAEMGPRSTGPQALAALARGARADRDVARVSPPQLSRDRRPAIEMFLKLLGVGMATAILVDATIVRMVLVPAVMQLLGRANWWMPRWLDRAVPRLAPEAR